MLVSRIPTGTNYFLVHLTIFLVLTNCSGKANLTLDGQLASSKMLPKSVDCNQCNGPTHLLFRSLNPTSGMVTSVGTHYPLTPILADTLTINKLPEAKANLHAQNTKNTTIEPDPKLKASVQNSKHIGLAVMIWRGDHNDSLPPDLTALTNALEKPKILISPRDESPLSSNPALSWTQALENSSYLYVGNLGNGKSNQIVAFEKLSSFKKEIPLILSNGSVDIVSADEAARRIFEQTGKTTEQLQQIESTITREKALENSQNEAKEDAKKSFIVNSILKGKWRDAKGSNFDFTILRGRFLILHIDNYNTSAVGLQVLRSVQKNCPSNSLAIIGIAAGNERLAEKRVQSYSIPYPLLICSPEIGTKLKKLKTPTYIILNPKGEIPYWHEGPLNGDDLQKAVEDIIGTL